MTEYNVSPKLSANSPSSSTGSFRNAFTFSNGISINTSTSTPLSSSGASSSNSNLLIPTSASIGSNLCGVSSPRNEFFVSQRATAASDFDSSRIDSLSLEEQEILANIQELQLQLMKLRADQAEDSDDEQASDNCQVVGATASQLIVVSNTLPIVLERVPQTGRWKATKTTGGLDKLMCLTGVRDDLTFLWVGWVGQHIPKHEHESVRRLLLQHNCLPVFISSDVASRHNGFSAEVLWSLFHYVSEPVALTAFTNASGSNPNGFHSTKRFNKQDWRAYESANESFADAIAEIYNEGDSVWIHDYHLMLLPSLLRQRIPLCQIGWFLHIPFPACDVYSRLPVRSQLLTGVLQADLIGFQTFDYERHFVSTCQRILEVECSHRGIRSTLGDRDHFTSIGVYPIGINVDPFARAASSSSTLHRVNELHQKFGNKRIILGVDRLDNIKGIPHKLLAMELLLNRFPEWQHNVVLVQIGVSTRSEPEPVSSTPPKNAPATVPASPGPTTTAGGVESQDPPDESSLSNDSDLGIQLEMSSQSYRNLLSQVNQLVGRINSAFGTLDYAPIHFLHQKTTQHEELCALYDLADVCLVTSTRDGMNLVAHEFIVCQQHFTRRKEERLRKSAGGSTNAQGATTPPPSPTRILTEWEGEEGGPGVLVLSEFAGCAQSLSGAIVVNPWNTEDTAMSIHQALSMCRAEREIRQQKLYRYVSSNTATAWSMQFLGDLDDAVANSRENTASLPKLDANDVVRAYRKAGNRVIILDYDRTLTPQHSLLPLAAVGPNFKNLLDTLSADPSNTVFIVSSRERKFLETWLNGVRVGVAAEDGFFYRMNLGNPRERWKTLSKFQYDTATRIGGGPSASAPSSDYMSPSEVQSMRSISLQSLDSSFPMSHKGFYEVEEGDMSWKDLVLPTMLTFTERTPGSYIEDKESSLTWHYDDADLQFGSWQARDLQIILERNLIGTALDVYQGNLCVYVEHEGCTKARVLEGILRFLSSPGQVAKKLNKEVDFVLCVCDDVSDQQMFQTLNSLAAESKERRENQQRLLALRRQNSGSGTGSMTSWSGRRVATSSTPPVSSSKPKSDAPLAPRRATMTQQTVIQEEETSSSSDDEDDDFGDDQDEDEDNKVNFIRLQKVPVRLAEDAGIFTVSVAHVNDPLYQRTTQSIQTRHFAYSVDSVAQIRSVLRDLAQVDREASGTTQVQPEDDFAAAAATLFGDSSGSACGQGQSLSRRNSGNISIGAGGTSTSGGAGKGSPVP